MAVMESTVRLITTITVLTFASSLVAGGTGHAGTVEAVMPSPPIDDRKRYLPFPLARRRPRPSSRWSAGLPAVAPPI